MGRPKAGSRLWNVGGFRPQRQGLKGAKRGGERHTHRGAETNGRTDPWTETGAGRKLTGEKLGKAETRG